MNGAGKVDPPGSSSSGLGGSSTQCAVISDRLGSMRRSGTDPRQVQGERAAAMHHPVADFDEGQFRDVPYNHLNGDRSPGSVEREGVSDVEILAPGRADALNRSWPKLVRQRRPPHFTVGDETVDEHGSPLLGERYWSCATPHPGSCALTVVLFACRRFRLRGARVCASCGFAVPFAADPFADTPACVRCRDSAYDSQITREDEHEDFYPQKQREPEQPRSVCDKIFNKHNAKACIEPLCSPEPLCRFAQLAHALLQLCADSVLVLRRHPGQRDSERVPGGERPNDARLSYAFLQFVLALSCFRLDAAVCRLLRVA